LRDQQGWLKAGLALATALLTCACGGGSGSGTSNLETPPPSVAAPPPPSQAAPPTPLPEPTTECETRDVYTLCVTMQAGDISSDTVQHMKDRFFDVYPVLVARFNHAAPPSVDFVIGVTPNVAGASGHTVTYQAIWMREHPQDYDVVVHELMHIVQNYSSSPGWLTEGIADYARYRYGVNNEAAGWHMQFPNTGSIYTDGYGVTARFLVWIEERYKIEIVDAIDAAIRGGSYSGGIWITLTGKSVDELWTDYFYDPALGT